jgi:transcriptional regulator with GAF, ATPase, and Fis domain
VARGIHAMSSRQASLLVPVKCGAMVETGMQRELFGHAKGAFTGAMAARKGKFDMADRGTLFLDEVGDLKLALQPVLLRFLEELQFEPVGENRTVAVDVRVIAATNVKLEDAVRRGTFRHDLFHRLNVFPIRVPPLRERLEDIPLLAAHFLRKYGARRGITRIAAEALDAMQQHDWPGNVRELENALRFAIDIATPPEVGPQDLPAPVMSRPEPQAKKAGRLKNSADAVTRTEVEGALIQSRGDRVEAARRLNVSVRTVYRVIRTFRIHIARKR